MTIKELYQNLSKVGKRVIYPAPAQKATVVKSLMNAIINPEKEYPTLFYVKVWCGVYSKPA